MLIDVIGYAASVAILIVYLLLATGKAKPIAFHWANALGAPPVIASEVIHGAYVPLVLTAFFGIIGAAGVIRHHVPDPERDPGYAMYERGWREGWDAGYDSAEAD